MSHQTYQSAVVGVWQLARHHVRFKNKTRRVSMTNQRSPDCPNTSRAGRSVARGSKLFKRGFFLGYKTLENIKPCGTAQYCGWAYVEPSLRMADEPVMSTPNISVTRWPIFFKNVESLFLFYYARLHRLIVCAKPAAIGLRYLNFYTWNNYVFILRDIFTAPDSRSKRVPQMDQVTFK